MLHVALLCATLLAAEAGDPPATSGDIRAYEALKAKAGKDAPSQVKLALWCEAHGLDAERVNHLARAVLADPKNVTARGLLGLLAIGGRWESAEKIGERIKADEQRAARLAEYNTRRAKLVGEEEAIQYEEGLYLESFSVKATRYSKEELFKVPSRPDIAYAVRLKGNRKLAQMNADLGIWCDQNGLKPESIAHFTTAVHLDPSRDASWRHLGCIRRNGRWMSPEQAAAEERDDHEQRLANRHWEPLLAKWKIWLGDPAAPSSHRAEARERLATVTDPRAIPLILKVFSRNGSETEQTLAVRLLGQIDDPKSSVALADLAVMSRWESVRRAAIAVLKERPRREYAGRLVEMIRPKIRYWFEPVAGPGSTGALVYDTPRVHMVLTYDAPAVFRPAPSFRGYVGYDSNGLPVIAQGLELDRMAREPSAQRSEDMQMIEARTAELLVAANIKAGVSTSRMAADLYEIEMSNDQAETTNPRVSLVLQLAADAPPDLKEDDEEAWHVWWYDKLGYSYHSPPKVTLFQNASPQLPGPYISTCFVAGTPVRTLDGPKPIEAIQVGDQVLSQDATTGALGFQAVVFLHHNPPGKTLRVSLADGESVVCSVYHRFWRANLGWAMARELNPGDTLRILGGLVKVDKVEPDTIQPLYNLDVSGPCSFFVGTSNVLVHDNTLPDHRLKPFDALPVVEQSAPR
jgi:hypothetical protein